MFKYTFIRRDSECVLEMVGIIRSVVNVGDGTISINLETPGNEMVVIDNVTVVNGGE